MLSVQCSVLSVQKAEESGQWSVFSAQGTKNKNREKWSVVRRQRKVVSVQWSEGSGQWSAYSVQKADNRLNI